MTRIPLGEDDALLALGPQVSRVKRQRRRAGRFAGYVQCKRKRVALIGKLAQIDPVTSAAYSMP